MFCKPSCSVTPLESVTVAADSAILATSSKSMKVMVPFSVISCAEASLSSVTPLSLAATDRTGASLVPIIVTTAFVVTVAAFGSVAVIGMVTVMV